MALFSLRWLGQTQQQTAMRPLSRNHSLLLFAEMKQFSAFWVHFTRWFPQQIRYTFIAKWEAFSRNKPPDLTWIVSLRLTCLGSGEGHHHTLNQPLPSLSWVYSSQSLSTTAGRGSLRKLRDSELPILSRFSLTQSWNYNSTTSPQCKCVFSMASVQSSTQTATIYKGFPGIDIAQLLTFCTP